MGEKADDTPAGSEPPDLPDSTSGQRGLLGRLYDAFSPSAAAERDADAAVTADAIGAPGLPGMGNLRRMRVDDVAIPKVEIIAVPATITMDDLVATFRDSGFSRLPVFKGTLDSPIGIIHLKDLALQHAFAATKTRFNLRKLLRPLLYAPPSMPIGVLLQKMQNEQIGRAHV